MLVENYYGSPYPAEFLYALRWGKGCRPVTYTLQLVTLGPFESKVFTHYQCCWGPHWKQSSLLVHYSCCWAPLKARYFTHYNYYWGLFESVVSLLTHYLCYCGPFESRVLTQRSCCWGPLVK